MSITRTRDEVKMPKTAELAGEVAIVTGASSGIGAATAQELARRGAQVVLAARRANELDAQVQSITEAGYRAVAIPTDVTDREQIAHLAEQTTEMFGRVDVLVNNAGIALRNPFTRNSVEEITQIVDVNLLGAILMTRAVLPGMLAQHHGAIISVASVGAHIAVDPLYSATKFGIRGFSLSLRRQLAGSGVSVSLVSPGFVRTPMNKHMRLKYLPGPELVASTIADLVTRPRREVVVPRYYVPMIEFDRLFPWLADMFIRTGRRVIGA